MVPNLCEPESVLVGVRGEYLEMPGLRRTSEGTFVRADSDAPRCGCSQLHAIAHGSNQISGQGMALPHQPLIVEAP